MDEYLVINRYKIVPVRGALSAILHKTVYCSKLYLIHARKYNMLKRRKSILKDIGKKRTHTFQHN